MSVSSCLSQFRKKKKKMFTLLSQVPLGTRPSDLHNLAHEDMMAFFAAAEKGDLPQLEHFVNERRVPVNIRDKTDGTQAIHLCCAAGAGVKCIEFLLNAFQEQIKEHEKSGDQTITATDHTTSLVDVRDNEDFTPLMTCASHDRLEELQYLLSRKADPYLVNKFGGTVLHTAVSQSSPKSHAIVHRILAATNSDPKFVNAQRRDGFTALHISCYFENVDLAKLLIVEAKADCTLKTNAGVTALAIACGRRKQESMLRDVIRPMIEQGHASPNSRSDTGETPLHAAAAEGRFDIVQYLCDQQGALLYFDKNRKSAFDFAKDNGHLDIAIYLKDYAMRKKAEMKMTENNSNNKQDDQSHDQPLLLHTASTTTSSRPLTPRQNDDDHISEIIALSKRESSQQQHQQCPNCAENFKSVTAMADSFQKERKQWSDKVNHLKEQLERSQKDSQREIERLKEVVEGANNARRFEVRLLQGEIEKLKTELSRK